MNNKSKTPNKSKNPNQKTTKKNPHEPRSLQPKSDGEGSKR